MQSMGGAPDSLLAWAALCRTSGQIVSVAHLGQSLWLRHGGLTPRVFPGHGIAIGVALGVAPQCALVCRTCFVVLCSGRRIPSDRRRPISGLCRYDAAPVGHSRGHRLVAGMLPARHHIGAVGGLWLRAGASVRTIGARTAHEVQHKKGGHAHRSNFRRDLRRQVARIVDASSAHLVPCMACSRCERPFFQCGPQKF